MEFLQELKALPRTTVIGRILIFPIHFVEARMARSAVSYKLKRLVHVSSAGEES